MNMFHYDSTKRLNQVKIESHYESTINHSIFSMLTVGGKREKTKCFMNDSDMFETPKKFIKSNVLLRNKNTILSSVCLQHFYFYHRVMCVVGFSKLTAQENEFFNFTISILPKYLYSHIHITQTR